MIIVGIAGPSAGGKTTITKKICSMLNENINIAIIAHDNYYKDQSEMPFEERVKTNYDHPNAFDTNLLINHLQTLNKGESVDIPCYNYVNHTRSEEKIHITPTDIIVVEVILTLENERLRELFDVKIYVDTDADECLIRRINRDIKERGRDLDFVMHQYLETVKPMLRQFIEPSKRHADIIIPNNNHNSIAIEVVANHLNKIK